MDVTASTVTTPSTDEGTDAWEFGAAFDTRAGDIGPRVSYPPSDRSKSRWIRAAFLLLGVAAFGTIGLTRRTALAESIARLGHLRWIWVPVALAFEWWSLSVFARFQRRLLEAGGAIVAAGSMLATVYAANALSTSVPLAGPELGAAFTFRRFKRQGVDSPLAAWSLMVGGVVSPVAGMFVFMVGALLSGNDLLALSGLLAGALGVAVMVVIYAASRNSRLRSAIEPAAARIIRRGRRILHRSGGDPTMEVRTWADRLSSLRPNASVWISVTALALANWLTDAAVLAASIYAVGAPVPWRALLLVYGSGVFVRSIGLTPGGLGLVEGTLCVGLVAAGVHVEVALASVLLYRLISFWIVAGAGWVVLLLLRHDRAIVPEAASEGVGGPSSLV